MKVVFFFILLFTTYPAQSLNQKIMDRFFLKRDFYINKINKHCNEKTWKKAYAISDYFYRAGIRDNTVLKCFKKYNHSNSSKSSSELFIFLVISFIIFIGFLILIPFRFNRKAKIALLKKIRFKSRSRIKKTFNNIINITIGINFLYFATYFIARFIFIKVFEANKAIPFIWLQLLVCIVAVVFYHKFEWVTKATESLFEKIIYLGITLALLVAFYYWVTWAYHTTYIKLGGFFALGAGFIAFVMGVVPISIVLSSILSPTKEKNK